jgi:hypothetical protein
LISTNNFMVDLILAANGIDKLTALETNRLLNRAATAMRELREQVGIPTPRDGADAVVEIRTAAVPFGRKTTSKSLGCY